MLLETAYNIIAIILHSRLLPIEESLDHEPQCGFRPDHGCIDAIFTVKSALQKQGEKNNENIEKNPGYPGSYCGLPYRNLHQN